MLATHTYSVLKQWRLSNAVAFLAAPAV